MDSTAPFVHQQWMLADAAQSSLEVLGTIAAVIGMLLWVGGLAWFIVRDVIHAVEHSHRHHDAQTGPGRNRSSRPGHTRSLR